MANGFQREDADETHRGNKATFEQFFKKAKLNPDAWFITGMICGYRVEEIENPADPTGQVSRQTRR